MAVLKKKKVIDPEVRKYINSGLYKYEIKIGRITKDISPEDAYKSHKKFIKSTIKETLMNLRKGNFTIGKK